MEQLNNLSLPNMPEMSEVLTSLMYGGEKQKPKNVKAASKKRQWGLDKAWYEDYWLHFEREKLVHYWLKITSRAIFKLFFFSFYNLHTLSI